MEHPRFKNCFHIWKSNIALQLRILFIFFCNNFVIQKNSVLFFLFFSPRTVEKVSFSCKILQIKILIGLKVLGLLNPKIAFLAVSLYACVLLYQFVLVAYIHVNPKQILALTLNSEIFVTIIHKCHLKLFIMIGQIVCVQGYSFRMYYECTTDYKWNFL